MKKALLWILGIVLVLTSLVLAGYPFVSSYLNSLNSDSEVLSYLDSADDLTNEERAQMLACAKEYNKSLIGNVTISDPFAEVDNVSDDYNSLLSIKGSSVMGTLEIPCINLNLPIYHGTGEDALQNGAGHLSNSSLPVGGVGTHAVLTGHTGVSNKKLFSDVASLKIGDVFFINVLGDKLAYQVDEINTVLPQDTEKLQIDPDHDYVTLVTCTPFGINTHRLLVRGTRISYDEASELTSDVVNDSTWNSEYIRAVIIGISVMAAILIVFGLIKLILYFRRKRIKNE